MLAEQDVIVQRQPGLLCEDNFNNGPSGWTQLVDGTVPVGPLVLDSEITFDNSAYSAMILTENYSNIGTKPWGSAMAIKRLARGADTGKIYVEMWWAWGSLYGENTPRAIDFGLDQADPQGNRRFFVFRWHNYDDEVANARVNRWELRNGAGYTNVAGGTIDAGYNENKRNLNHLEFVVDVGAGVYDGLRVNGTGFGSLASTPDESLRAFAPPVTSLVPFSSGCNLTMELRNRLNTNNTKAWANLAYVRAVQL